MKKVAILQSNYIPWKGDFELINKVDKFVVFDTVQFTKRDWRNRNKIIGTSGDPIWLSIPVKSKTNSKSLIKDICVVDNKWRHKHFATIQSSYKKSEFFSQYEQTFKDLYFGSDEHNLSKINLMFIKKICEILEINTTIFLSSEYECNLSATEKLLKECTKYQATKYISGLSANSYLDLEKFNLSNIDVCFMNYTTNDTYSEKSHVFTHYVSVLDLIFNVGPGAKKHIGN